MSTRLARALGALGTAVVAGGLLGGVAGCTSGEVQGVGAPVSPVTASPNRTAPTARVTSPVAPATTSAGNEASALVHRPGVHLQGVDFATPVVAAAMWSNCEFPGIRDECRFALTTTADGWQHATTLPGLLNGDGMSSPNLYALPNGSVLVDPVGEDAPLTEHAADGSLHPVFIAATPLTVGPGSPLVQYTPPPTQATFLEFRPDYVYRYADHSLHPVAGSDAGTVRSGTTIDADGVLHALVTDRAGNRPAGGPCGFSASTDGGAHWTTTIPLADRDCSKIDGFAVRAKTVVATVYRGDNTPEDLLTGSPRDLRRTHLAQHTPNPDGIAAIGSTFVATLLDGAGNQSWATVDPDTARLGPRHHVTNSTFWGATGVRSGMSWDQSDTTVTVHLDSPTSGITRTPR